jgi:hypothetical protein
MRCLIAGVKDGQSCIIETISCDGGGPDAVIHELFEIATLPPQARPAGLGACGRVAMAFDKFSS